MNQQFIKGAIEKSKLGEKYEISALSPHIEKYLSYAIIMIMIQGLIFKTEIF